jgi:hypothetical protein
MQGQASASRVVCRSYLWTLPPEMFITLAFQAPHNLTILTFRVLSTTSPKTLTLETLVLTFTTLTTGKG